MSTPAVTTTEAPFSMTFKITTPEGAEVLVTMRPNISTIDEHFEALEELNQLTKQLKAANYTVPAPYSGGGNRGGGGGGYTPKAAVLDESIPEASRTCACGPRVKKSGSSAKGPWTGYLCPKKRCPAIWA
jgi:hypothetical protein